MNIKKTIFFLCILSAILFLVYKHQETHFFPQQHLIIGLNNDPMSLDPRAVSLNRDISIIKNIYEGLTRENTNHSIDLALALYYDLSEDKTTYTFYLKPSYWSNGDPLTALDFEETIKSTLKNHSLAISKKLLYIIKNAESIAQNKLPVDKLHIKALDDLTLQIKLEKSHPNFLKLLAHPIFFPTHKSFRQNMDQLKPSPQIPISNGPFKIKKYQLQEYILLEKNNFYHDSKNVYLNKITLKILPNSYTTNYLLNKKEIHWQGPPFGAVIPPEIIQNTPETHKKNDFNVLGLASIILNTQKPPMNNLNLRKALYYSIDLTPLLSSLNLKRKAHSLLPEEFSVLEKKTLSDQERISLAKYFFNKAKKELTQEQLEHLSIIYPTENKNFNLVVQELQQQWIKNLNLKISILNLEYHEFIKRRFANNFDLAMGGWIAEYNHPLAFLSLLGNITNTNEPSHHFSKWHNKNYNTLLSKLYYDYDKEKQKEAEILIYEDKPLIPLYYYHYTYLTNISIKNVFHSHLGSVDLKSAKIIN